MSYLLSMVSFHLNPNIFPYFPLIEDSLNHRHVRLLREVQKKLPFTFFLKFYESTLSSQREHQWENQESKANLKQQLSCYEITYTVSMEIEENNMRRNSRK